MRRESQKRDWGSNSVVFSNCVTWHLTDNLCTMLFNTHDSHCVIPSLESRRLAYLLIPLPSTRYSAS